MGRRRKEKKKKISQNFSFLFFLCFPLIWVKNDFYEIEEEKRGWNFKELIPCKKKNSSFWLFEP